MRQLTPQQIESITAAFLSVSWGADPDETCDKLVSKLGDLSPGGEFGGSLIEDLYSVQNGYVSPEKAAAKFIKTLNRDLKRGSAPRRV